MPEILFTSLLSDGVVGAMEDSQMELDRAVAAVGSLVDIHGVGSADSIVGAMPTIAFTRGYRLDGGDTCMNGQVEGVGAGTAVGVGVVVGVGACSCIWGTVPSVAFTSRLAKSVVGPVVDGQIEGVGTSTSVGIGIVVGIGA